jgi:hypothetical protein
MGAQSIRESFVKLMNATDPIRSVEVISVEFPTFTGKLITGEELPNIRLVAEESDNNIYVIPKVGTNVIIGFVDKMNAILLLPAEVDEVYLRGEAEGGLVKVNDLVTKLNNIESDLNTLKTAFSSWVVVPSDGGAALKAITATWSGQQLTQTTVNDLENDNVKHG